MLPSSADPTIADPGVSARGRWQGVRAVRDGHSACGGGAAVYRPGICGGQWRTAQVFVAKILMAHVAVDLCDFGGVFQQPKDVVPREVVVAAEAFVHDLRETKVVGRVDRPAEAAQVPVVLDPKELKQAGILLEIGGHVYSLVGTFRLAPRPCKTGESDQLIVEASRVGSFEEVRGVIGTFLEESADYTVDQAPGRSTGSRR